MTWVMNWTRWARSLSFMSVLSIKARSRRIPALWARMVRFSIAHVCNFRGRRGERDVSIFYRRFSGGYSRLQLLRSDNLVIGNSPPGFEDDNWEDSRIMLISGTTDTHFCGTRIQLGLSRN